MSVVSLSGDSSLLMGRRASGPFMSFLRNFKKMNRAQRKTAWKKIPRARKAAWLLLYGPVLLPLIAAAGVAVTATASAAPFALLAIRSRIKKRRARLAALKRKVVIAEVERQRAVATGNPEVEARAIATGAATRSEIATETTALQSDENQVSDVNKDAGGTGEEEKTPEVSPEAVKEAEAVGTAPKGNAGALIPIGALAALALL